MNKEEIKGPLYKETWIKVTGSNQPRNGEIKYVIETRANTDNIERLLFMFLGGLGNIMIEYGKTEILNRKKTDFTPEVIKELVQEIDKVLEKYR